MEVVVFGKAGYNTLGVLRSFKKQNIDTFLLLIHSKQMKTILCSNAITRFKIVTSEEEGVNFLLNYYSNEEGKTVIIPTSDSAESILDWHYHELINRYYFPNCGKVGQVNLIMDKKIMTDYAKENNIAVPYSVHYSKSEIIPDYIPYPCIIKPQKSIMGSKADIRVCRNQRELERAIQDAYSTHSFLIQQYILKEYDILLIGCRLNSTGQVFLPGIFKKYRWISNGEDGSWGIITSHIEQYFNKENIIGFLNDLNYFGPFSIEFGVMDNIPYFFEINLRNDGTSHYFNKLQVDIPYIWSLDCMGKDVTSLCSPLDIDYYFIDEFGDFLNVFTTKLTIKKWVKDLRKATAFKYYSESDSKPFWRMLPRRVGKTIYLIFKSILK